MKKIMTAIAATIIASTCIFLACSKEENETVKNDTENFKIEAFYNNSIMSFELIDDTDSLWRWQHFKHDKFIIDQDVYLNIENAPLSLSKSNDNTLEFTDYAGNTFFLTDIESKGNITTAKILINESDFMELIFTFTENCDFMNSMANHFQCKEVGGSNNPVWKIVQFILSCIVSDTRDTTCSDKVENAVTRCRDNGCTAQVGECCVKCIKNNRTSKNVDCSSYNYFGGID